eukprot:TRINITY_DN12578_c0_g1_i1.p1 TRINITY_DN12578_c0_g1~~TRINITY_DN12578_c0_g1_i1.p1  ORF type:complete len:131 (-),score=23.58 TRINITY_DN12578_c0_g1_i1:66-458(-)
MTTVYYRDAHAALIVVDCSNPKSLSGAVKWKKDLDHSLQKTIPTFLTINKCDLLEKPLDQEEINKFCQENNITQWFEVSAKDGYNITPVFDHVIDVILGNGGLLQDAMSSRIKVTKPKQKVKPRGGPCCP